jgi:hypothetical protein
MPVAIGIILANMGIKRVAKKSSTITVGATITGIGRMVSTKQSGSNIQTNGSTARLVMIPYAGTPPFMMAKRGIVVAQGAATPASQPEVFPNNGDTKPCNGSTTHTRPSIAHQPIRKPGVQPEAEWVAIQNSSAKCKLSAGGTLQPWVLPNTHATPISHPRQIGAEKPTKAAKAKPHIIAPRPLPRLRILLKNASAVAIISVI